MKDKKVISYIGCTLISIGFIFILLISSVEIGAYSNWGFYEEEYSKYQVLKDVQMEMPDVMYVTKEMMAYLKGERENLVVDTVVDGQEREFFNEREIAHMEDVQHLFLIGIGARRIVLAIIGVLLCFQYALGLKWGKLLPRIFQYTTIGLGVVSGGLVALIATDFNKYFTLFHEIFFTNDLWLLDPETDLLINILPEGFFVDMASRIGMIFGGLMALTFGIVTIIKISQNKTRKAESKN